MEHQPETEKKRGIQLLAESAAACTACDLCRTRTKVVFGDGNPDSPLMVIGEGPGANEDATGLPFVGRAGKLLDECLREAGMLRKHVYIANVVKCRPTLIENGRLQNRPPRNDEASTCVPLWLDKQVAIIDPLVIVCLGNPSANAIIHTGFRMLAERGQWKTSKYACPAIASLHPAFILRQGGEGSEGFDRARSLLVADLSAAREKARELKKGLNAAGLPVETNPRLPL